MFAGCSNLEDAYVYLLDWGSSTTGWLSGVSPTGTFRRYGKYDYETGMEAMLEVRWGADYIPGSWNLEPPPQMTSPSYISQKYSGVINYTLAITTEDKSAEFEYFKESEEDSKELSVSSGGHISGSYSADIGISVVARDKNRGYEYRTYIWFTYQAPSNQ
jgi:hypothetical protein